MPEIFNGDGCSAEVANPRRWPVRKSAVIELMCRPCPPADQPQGTPAYGRICDVRRADNCTLRVVFSMQCPPRQLVYAPTLDVGSSPGARDLIAQGAPAGCTFVPPAGAGSVQLTDLLVAEERPSIPDEAARQWQQQLVAAHGERTLYVSLTYGVLAVGPAELRVATMRPRSPDCAAHLDAPNALVSGGVLRAIDGPLPLRLRCTCETAAVVNLTLTLRVVDFTSPVVTLPHTCDAGPRT